MGYRTTFLLTISLVAFTATSAAARGFYSWVDEKGNIHYSDKVPPSHSQSGHKVIDSGGQILDQVAPRKTDAQLKKEQEEARQRELLRQQQREQRIRDTTLLSTFSSVEEMDRIRDQRLTTLESLVRLARKKIGKLTTKLEAAENRRDALQANGKKIPFQLRENIQVLEEQIRHQEHRIGEHHKRSAEMIERFRRDRARFVELTQK